MPNNLLQMNLNLLQKKQFRKPLKELVTWLVIKFLIKLEKCREVYHKNSSETVESKTENTKSLEERQRTIDDLRLI